MLSGMTPETRDAKMIAREVFADLVGERCRLVPMNRSTQTPLESQIEYVALKGELAAMKRILKTLESEVLTRSDIIGDLHLSIMSLNNHIKNNYNKGELIPGVEYFINEDYRYIQ